MLILTDKILKITGQHKPRVLSYMQSNDLFGWVYTKIDGHYALNLV